MEEEQEEKSQVGIVLSGAIAVGVAVGCVIVMTITFAIITFAATI